MLQRWLVGHASDIVTRRLWCVAYLVAVATTTLVRSYVVGGARLLTHALAVLSESVLHRGRRTRRRYADGVGCRVLPNKAIGVWLWLRVFVVPFLIMRPGLLIEDIVEPGLFFAASAKER